MADTEILVETAPNLNMEDIKKIVGTEKIKAINGVSLEEKKDKEANMENGNITSCKFPQLNGDISDKSPTTNDSESKEIILKSNIAENRSRPMDEIEKNSSDKISNNHSDINSDVNKCDEDTSRSNISSEIKSELNDVEVSEETLEPNTDTMEDTNCEESINTSVNDKNKVGAVKDCLSNNVDSEDCQSSGSVNISDKSFDVKKEENAFESKVDIDSKDNEEVSVIDKDKNDKLSEKSPTKRSKKNDLKVNLPKRITRSSSGISKAVKYSDAASLSCDEDDDDDIKITKEVKKREDIKKKDEESDIEMIEECDPLAISDADVIKAKESVKESVTVSNVKPLLKTKQAKTLGGPKKDSNVIIIDTNTLLKQQGSIVAGVHTTSKTAKASSVSASAQTTSAVTTISPAVQIQNAIQAITGGNPAIQGLQSAYLSAIQQVLIAQGGGQVSNPHYLAQLQQYYNTLGALQDDAYVIEAPSFIVPYVMEGKPVESIKEYLEKVNKEYAENEKKKVEEDKKEKLIADSKTNDGDDEKLPEKEKVDASNDDQDNGSSPMDVMETNCLDKDEKKLKDSPLDKENIETNSIAVDKSEDDSIEDEKSNLAGADEEKGISEKVVAKETDETDKSAMEEELDNKSEQEKGDKPVVEKPVEKDTKEIEGNESEKSAIEQDQIKDKDDDNENMEIDDENKDIIEVSKTSEKLEKENKSTSSSEDDNKENKSSAENKTVKKEEEIIDLDKEDEIVKKESFKHLGRWESYYKSALGRFFLDLGLNHAQEFIQADLLKMQRRKLEKMKSNPSRQDILGVKVLESQLKATKRKNEHLSIPLKTCKFCSFKTESQLVMERHLESPHMINYTYKCNFCEFETRAPQVILFHTEAEHNVRGRLERAPAFFQCAICPYEDNNKSKMTRHALSCIKKFKPEKNCDLSDWEPPAKIPKIQRGRPNSFCKTFESMKMSNVGMMPKNLSGLGLNTIQTALSGGLLPGGAAASHVNSLIGRGRGRPVGSYKTLSQSIGVRTNNASMIYQNRVGAGLLQPIPGVTSAQQLSLANQVLQSVTQGGNRVNRILPTSGNNNIIPGLAASSSITIQSVQNKTGSSKSPQQPSISITPLPRGGSQPSNTKSNTSNSARPAFVICEICDGYIKDLEQLRNHMNLIHKVKIHPKMIYNRPPLNCQKCQHRFFTDQGLERHLLGTHGLVTSSMQEAANKGKDAGRCPICGKVFQWKLLNHVSRDHKMTLKPAHLSYKCTVCTATFNMYRLFENHVYSAHSVVNKNKNNENIANNSTPTKKPTEVAPMKINDEITIIPQPASKNSKVDGKPSVKKSESPSVSKEITITKVGTTSRRRSGGGVEVISLDDSPQKRQLEEAPKKKSRETSTSKRARTSS